MKRHEAMRIILKRMIVSPVVFAAMFIAGAVPNAQALNCSNATLQGGYGTFANSTVLPAGTPRAVLGRFSFDGRGHFTITLTFNDNGTVIHASDFGTYTVNADCTGKIFTNGGTKTIEIVLVDGGKEFYALRTDPSNILDLFGAAKKQFPGSDEER